jgi:hypothetical protein
MSSGNPVVIWVTGLLTVSLVVIGVVLSSREHPKVEQPPIVRTFPLSLPIHRIEERLSEPGTVVTMTTIGPPLPSSLRQQYPHLRGTVTRNGEILDLRGTGGYEPYERWAIEMVRNGYRPSPQVVQRGGEIQIIVQYVLSQ